MEAIYITPEDVGASGYWSGDWIKFCMLFGYTESNTPDTLLLTEIKIKNA